MNKMKIIEEEQDEAAKLLWNILFSFASIRLRRKEIKSEKDDFYVHVHMYIICT
jgi:hypothetical protein